MITKGASRWAGFATPEGTARYAGRFPEAAPGHFRPAGGLLLSSLGIGTYLGSADERTDRGFAEAVERAVERGANVIDTAINYRFQRSERSVGAALRRLAGRGFSRDEIVLCTKGGYIAYDGEPPRSPDDAARYIRRTFLDPGIVAEDEIVQRAQCLAPAYLAHQVRASLANLGVETIDVYYLHNPEVLLTTLPRAAFRDLMRRAFERMETEAREGRVRWYGTATWEGYRTGPDHEHWLDLPDLAALAREVGGPEHRFRFIQLPVNLAMAEAYAFRNQPPAAGRTVLEAAADEGILVVASAALLQGRLLGRVPDAVAAALPGAATDSLRALQFARSVPGVTTALVGMSRAGHAEENLALAALPPASREALDGLFRSA